LGVNAEVLAEWYRMQDRRVVRTPSAWWFEASYRVYQAIPYHWSILPQEGELEALLRTERAIAVRCTTPMEAPVGQVSYHATCEDRAYDLAKLDVRSRGNVRYGLRRARIEQIPAARIAEEGWDLEVETCRRQGRDVPVTRDAWRRRYLAADSLPGFEGWGAIVEGRLAACLLALRIDDWYELLSQQSRTESLNSRSNNALAFVATRSMLQRPDVRGVLYTIESLAAPRSVDEFKFRMGYEAMPVRQLVAFHPWVERLVGSRVHRLLSAAVHQYPRTTALAKAEGMVRFHLQGKLPAERQAWPGRLLDARSALLARLAAAQARPNGAPDRGQPIDGRAHIARR
jgi:hypothetical protein